MEPLETRLTLSSDTPIGINPIPDPPSQLDTNDWQPRLRWEVDYDQTTVAPSTLRIAALGDSMTYEGGGSYVSVLRNILSDSTATIQSFASAGWKADKLLSVWETEVRDKGFDSIIVFAGVPDLTSVDSTAHTIFRSLQSLYNDATSRGISVICVNVSPWAQYKKWTPQRQTETLHLNELIRQHVAEHSSTMRYVDAYAGLGAPAEPQRLSPRFDVGDGLHLVPTGDEQLARLISNSVLSLEAPTLVPQSAVLSFNRAIFGLTTQHILLEDAGTRLPVQLATIDDSHYRIDFWAFSKTEVELTLNLDLNEGPIFDSGFQSLRSQPPALLRVDYQIPQVSLTTDEPAVSSRTPLHVRVAFNEPVTNLNSNNFRLLRDRIEIHPLIALVTRRDDSTFDLWLDLAQTNQSGTYQLIYEPSMDVQDMLGNLASQGALLTWVKLDVAPSMFDSTLRLPGTSGMDNIEIVVRRDEIEYTINGMEQSFPRIGLQRIEVDPGAGRDLVSLMVMDDAVPISASAFSTDGEDRAYLYDSNGNDVFTAGANRSSLTSSLSELIAIGFAQVTAISRLGNDIATLHDSNGADKFQGSGWLTNLKGLGFEVTTLNFPSVLALSQNGGTDTADLFDSPSNDTVQATMDQLTLSVPGYLISVKSYSRINVRATQGMDLATLSGSQADERFVGQTSNSVWIGGSFSRYFYSFDQVDVSSGGGNDQVTVYDSPGDDVLIANSNTAVLTSRASQITVRDFFRANIYARSGMDSATFNGTGLSETFTAQSAYSSLTVGSFATFAYGFDKVSAISGGGNDMAKLFGSTGNDYFEARGASARFFGTGFDNTATGFPKVTAYSQAGLDTALLIGTSATETVTGRPTLTTMTGNGFNNSANQFASITVVSGGGPDIATLYDSAGDDLFVANPSQSRLSGAAYSITAQNYVRVNAYASAGTDQAELTGSAGDDIYTGRPADSVLKGVGFTLYASGFDGVLASGNGGNDISNLYDSTGDDQANIGPTQSSLVGVQYNNRTTDFDRVQMYASTGNDTVIYVDSLGNERFVGSGTSATIIGPLFVASLQRFDSITISDSHGGTDLIQIGTIAYQMNVGLGWKR